MRWILTLLFIVPFICNFTLGSIKTTSREIGLEVETSERFLVSIDTSNPNIINSTSFYEDDLGLIILPKGYSSKCKPIKLVIYCHGGSGYVTNTSSESEKDDYCRYLVSLGYAILDMTGCPETLAKRLDIDQGRTVGSFVALNAYKSGYDYVIKNYNINRDSCYLFANSNGGLVASNLINLTNIPFVAQAGVCPLLSIKLNAWNIPNASFRSTGFENYQIRANIIRIYGMKDIETQIELKNALYEDDKVGNYDPYDYIIKNKIKYRTPYKIFQPKDDPIVNYDIAKNFSEISNNLGAEVVLRAFEFGGHTPEPNPESIGSYIFKQTTLPLTSTVKEVAEWFLLHDKEKADRTDLPEFQTEGNTYKIFPNPNYGIFTIESMSDNSNIIELELFTSDGKLLLKQILNQFEKKQISFGKANLPKGNYNLLIKSGLNIVRRKIIVT